MSTADQGPNFTEYEAAALAEYDATIAGIPDCFDCLDVSFDDLYAPTLDELVALAPLLGQWWEAIDSLDADIGGPDTGIAAHFRICNVVGDFMQVRQQFLFALARAAGAKVPRPDHNAGVITTSNHYRGFFGLHDPDLKDRIERRRVAYSPAHREDQP